MAKFITLTCAEFGSRTRINADLILAYEPGDMGTHLVRDPAEGPFFHVTETPEQIDAMLGVTESPAEAALKKARPLVALFADNDRWEELQPAGSGTERGWFLNVSEAGCPAATDTAQEVLGAIDDALRAARGE